MADIKSPEERSLNMAKIRSKDTRPEEYIRKLLYAHGYRYRKNDRGITGHPDIWLARYNTAIFVNGCYWHRHPECKYAYMPKSRVAFWKEKFDSNIRRDIFVREEIKNAGIKMLVIWECTIKKMQRSEEMEKEILEKTEAFFTSEELYLEL